MRESRYQKHVIDRLAKTFPNCIILKNDSGYYQGIPDLLILFQNHWAMLEVKQNRASDFQPNQLYYLDVLNEMSYAAVIYPENEDGIFRDLQHTFSARGASRVFKR